jgi:site-specific DNA recombinase
MNKAILYIRVSTDEQAEKGHSLAYQEEKLRMYCKLKGIDVVNFYKEDHSAKSFERPQFKNLLNFLRKNKGIADTLLFIKWDRFSRNAGDSYQMIKTLNKLGVEPHATEQPLDLSVPENKTMLALYLTIPEVENDRRSLNIIAGIRRGKREGNFIGGAPAGYKNARNERNQPIIIPHPEQSIFIPRLFKEVAKGIKPLSHIFQELKADGFNCTSTNVYRIIVNPVYYGGIEIGAYKDEPFQIVKGIHEPLISKELFEDANAVMTNKAKKVPTNNLRREEFPMRGFLKCGVCGRNLTGSKSKGRHGGLFYYYHCKGECKTRFRAEKANEAILDLLTQIKPTPIDIAIFKKECKLSYENNEDKRKEKMGSVITDIKKTEERLVNAQKLVLDGMLDMAEYKSMKANLESELARFKIATSQLDSVNNEVRQFIEYSTLLFENIDQHYLSADLEMKIRLLGWMFPQKLTIENIESRTPITNNLYSLISNATLDYSQIKKGKSTSKNVNSPSVESRGVEPLSKHIRQKPSTCLFWNQFL